MTIIVRCLSVLLVLGCIFCLLCGCGECSEDCVAFVVAGGDELDIYINDSLLTTADGDARFIPISEVCEVAGINGRNARIMYTYPDDGSQEKSPHTLYIENHKDKRLVFKSDGQPVDVQVSGTTHATVTNLPYTKITYRIKIMK